MDATDKDEYPLFMGYLPTGFADKLKNELNESAELRKEKIEQVRALLRSEREINEEWFSDDVIIMYLRGRKYRVPEVFAAIKRMVTFVRKHKNLFQPLDPDVIGKCWDMGYSRFAPVRNTDGCAIINIRMGLWDPSEVKFNDHISYVVQTFLRVVSDPMTQVNGVALLYDFSDSFSLRYAPYMTVPNLRKMYQLFFDCMPIRLKALHGLNPNLFTKIVLSVLLKLASEKLKQRIFIHGKVEDSLHHVQTHAVPTEYGGKCSDQEMNGDWMKTVSHPDYILSILKSG